MVFVQVLVRGTQTVAAAKLLVQTGWNSWFSFFRLAKALVGKGWAGCGKNYGFRNSNRVVAGFSLKKVLAEESQAGCGESYGFRRSNRVFTGFSRFERAGWHGQTAANLTFGLASGGLVDNGYAKSVTFGQAGSVFAAGWFWVFGRWAGRCGFCGFRSV